MTQPSKRGGPRPGAGRPSLPYKARNLTVKLPGEVIDAFRAHCEKRGETQAECMTRMIRRELKKD